MTETRQFVFWLLIASVSFVFTTSSIATAADDETEDRYAMMTVDQADKDYFFQGEFVGEIRIENEQRNVGLQVVALGKQKYAATQYNGGLPGDGWDGELPTRMVGNRTEDMLVLSGGDFALISKRDHCLMINGDGKKIGKLKRAVRTSPTMGAQPPEQALVLFDGENTDQFSIGKMTENGLLKQGADVKPMIQDFNLHVEFQLSFMPRNEGQHRSNSGLYLQSRYEVQVLDSFGLEPVNNGCGAIYQFRAPDLNMCFPPLSWQTYDVVFTSPRFASDGTKIQDAIISVWLNGVLVHDQIKLPNKTGAGQPEQPTLLPIRLQDHSDQVRYRNIWIIDRGLAVSDDFPVKGD